MKAYSRIKRLAVLAARDGGKSAKEVADRFGVSESWVRRVVQQRRELAKLGPYKYRFRDRHTASLSRRARYMVREDPRITVKELERALGTKLSIDHLQGIKDELDISWDVVWYGGLATEFVLSPTGNYTTGPRGGWSAHGDGRSAPPSRPAALAALRDNAALTAVRRDEAFLAWLALQPGPRQLSEAFQTINQFENEVDETFEDVGMDSIDRALALLASE